MFTGIVDHCGVISGISHCKNSTQLKISHAFLDLALGESICVDGVCLTVIDLNDNTFTCDVSPETIDKTVVKYYRLGSCINLERAMRLSDRFGGHIVTGHVDATVQIQQFEKENEFIVCKFSSIQSTHTPFLTTKGSVCINGVSLTINQVDSSYFSVMLIPHTLLKTNLSALKTGDFVNVEYDYLAKLVQRGRYVAAHS